MRSGTKAYLGVIPEGRPRIHLGRWMVHRGDRFLSRGAKQLGVETETFLRSCFRLLDWNAMRLGPRVLANSGDLPGHFHVGLIRLDGEFVIRDLSRDDRLRKLTNYCELVAEVAIQRLEPVESGDSTKE